MSKKFNTNQAKINKIEITDDTISGRRRLVLFLKYLENTKYYFRQTRWYWTMVTRENERRVDSLK